MGTGLKPQKKLQGANQDCGHLAGGKEEGRRENLRDEKRPDKRGRLRKVEGESLHSFHVRSQEESASPLPDVANGAGQR